MDSSTALFDQLKVAEPFFLLAGPNVIESEEHILRMANHLKTISTKYVSYASVNAFNFEKNDVFVARVGLPLVFKSSFDKANRTSSKSFRGPGMSEGLKILEKVKIAYDIPIVTDVHETIQCEPVGKVADIIQIPAFLCRQTDLLVAAAKTGKIINIKKGQFCAPSVMSNSAEKVRLAGNPNVMVCERGTMFGYGDLIVDPRNLEWIREANCPVIVLLGSSTDVLLVFQFTCYNVEDLITDSSVSKQLDGGGVASGGLRELIPCIARTAVAVGVDGIFMEVHDDPLNAPVDGPTQWPLRHLEELLEELVAIAERLNCPTRGHSSQGHQVLSSRTCCFIRVAASLNGDLAMSHGDISGEPFSIPEAVGNINVGIPKTSEATSNLIQRLMLADLDPAAAKSAVGILGPFLSAFSFLFILRIVMSWYPKLPVGKFPYVLVYAPTEPLLIPTRKLIPPLGGVDVTPVVWFGLLSFLNEILVGPQGLLVLLSQQIS
ncbi:hypothetical protein H0E87_011048 [Populus deltoides]|uniref:3-deoxy-8-phosphooctulonate synthase n=1 Tax=Populus deltoides TaxID=3696 RepID=A0A8T2YVS5_POPDE|nr:hypothetical protein H0E87_011048 [Populus deltoides]